MDTSKLIEEPDHADNDLPNQSDNSNLFIHINRTGSILQGPLSNRDGNYGQNLQAFYNVTFELYHKHFEDQDIENLRDSFFKMLIIFNNEEKLNKQLTDFAIYLDKLTKVYFFNLQNLPTPEDAQKFNRQLVEDCLNKFNTFQGLVYHEEGQVTEEDEIDFKENQVLQIAKRTPNEKEIQDMLLKAAIKLLQFSVVINQHNFIINRFYLDESKRHKHIFRRLILRYVYGIELQEVEFMHEEGKKQEEFDQELTNTTMHSFNNSLQITHMLEKLSSIKQKSLGDFSEVQKMRRNNFPILLVKMNLFKEMYKELCIYERLREIMDRDQLEAKEQQFEIYIKIGQTIHFLIDNDLLAYDEFAYDEYHLLVS